MVAHQALLLAAVFFASRAAATTARAQQPIVYHKKLPRSALLAQKKQKQAALLQTELRSGMHGMELLQALASADGSQPAPPPAAGAGSVAAAAERVQDSVKEAQEAAAETLHNTETERDMLETQLLANGEGLHVIKKLAETVQKMKSQVEVLENHERICRKKLADIQISQNQVSQDTALANSVDSS